MTDVLTYEPLAPEWETRALALVQTVFDAFVAPGFTEQGCVSFYDYLDRFAFSRRTGDGFALAARQGETLVGVLEVVGGDHVALFFVSADCQGRGVGSALMRKAVEMGRRGDPELTAFTVNASPGSVKAYARMGFVAIDQEQERDGIRFIPMTLAFDAPPGKGVA